jgi:thiol-disulfide isomerase/thioredoxin
MKNIGKKIVIGIVILIMIVPIIVEVVGSSYLKTITAGDFEKFVSDTSNYGFGLLYVGKDDKDVKKTLHEIVNSYDGNSANISVSTYFIDIDKMTNEDEIKIFKTQGLETGYVFAVNGEVQRIETSALTYDRINSYVKEYTSQGIDEDIKYYKTIETADEYKKLVKDKKNITMAVFGRDTCAWCNLFKPVYNTVAEEYNLDIYYINSDSLNVDEYNEIINMGLVLPKSCTNEEDKNLSEGFGTPLTVFTKNGKIIDCIASGYMNKSALITKLQTVGLIKE